LQLRQRRAALAAPLAALGVAALAALLSAGCGSSGSDPTARIRGVDLAATAGTAGVLANGTALGGDLSFGQGSSYQFVGPNLLIGGFTTSTGASSTATITIPASPALRVSTGSFYTAYLIGLAALPNVATGKPDPRLLQTVLTGDRGAAAGYSASAPYADPPAGAANVRLLNGAADAGTVDVLVNGKVLFPGVAYPALPVRAATADTSAPAVNPVTLYQVVPAGTLSVQVNAAGTATVLVPPTNVPVSGGKAYTLVVTEPTAAPAAPTYGIYTSGDQE